MMGALGLGTAFGPVLAGSMYENTNWPITVGFLGCFVGVYFLRGVGGIDWGEGGWIGGSVGMSLGICDLCSDYIEVQQLPYLGGSNRPVIGP